MRRFKLRDLGEYLPSDVQTVRAKVKETLQDAFDATDHRPLINYGTFSNDPVFKVDLKITNGGCVLLPGAEKDTSRAGAARMRAVLKAAGIDSTVSPMQYTSHFPGVVIVLAEPEAALRLAALLVERLPAPHANRYRLRQELVRLGIVWHFDIEHGGLRPRPLSVRSTHALYTAVHGPVGTTFDLTQDDSITQMLAGLTHELAQIGVDTSAQLSRCCRPLDWPCKGPHDVAWGWLSGEAANRLTAALEAAPGDSPAARTP
ncbi:hypothetical protein N4G70_32145 [Streptomyces sp. ASQP_92]|uniref:hypothetical protein n=1 Tax=Streptomyces sp. ASQP_92 TaxID=2979116 RepID=UPI0021C11E5F|nr:hypothetical protein [Streptomyces sp. ASQP_92]MCT9093485.1 hypothetical protein [Streptomyces sp. ASQP_92]